MIKLIKILNEIEILRYITTPKQLKIGEEYKIFNNDENRWRSWVFRGKDFHYMFDGINYDESMHLPPKYLDGLIKNRFIKK